MILNYKTNKLPLNFIYLGIMLFVISIWRMLVLDWAGILFFLISLLLLFIRAGIIIDTDNRRLKIYTSFFEIKKGKWDSIKSILNLQIIKTRETQRMNVLSISRIETNDVYKLFMVLHDKKIEIMSGEKDYIFNIAEKIYLSLKVSLKNRTN
ncbi:MAG: hypothetical protein JXR51_16300 [Bacteroidales bacterium]|nr:hypothetical protein [Bacteroidales bacterium]MBN2758728.1 hypothetical protein [Bacteroidales bacterium]